LEYRVVPAPTQVVVSGDRGLERVAYAYQEIINREAAQGWTFIAMDTTTMQRTSCGCNVGPPTVTKIIVFGK
jgi:Domain of unknown function (DUF4177)